MDLINTHEEILYLEYILGWKSHFSSDVRSMNTFFNNNKGK